MKHKLNFTGNGAEFFIAQLGLSILSFITFGLGLTYQFYWIVKYFIENTEIEELK